MKLRSFVSVALALASLTPACSPTQEHLLAASAAFDECDLRTAHTEFDAAYALEPGNADAALGFALTDTVLLPEDPEITAALARIGFTAPIDSELVLFGPNALLERLRRGESCDAIGDHLESTIPYPPLTSGVNARTLFRADLNGQQMLDHLTVLAPRLARLSRAFETAADGMAGRQVTLDGTCGLTRTVVQAPELYAAAGAFALLEAAIAIAPAYDWSMTAVGLFSSEPEAFVEAVSRLLAVRDAGRAEQGRAILIRALTLLLRGVEAAGDMRTPVSDAAFDWTAMSPTVYADLALMLERAISSLEERRPETIPFLTPAIDIDVSRFLSAPPDSASLAVPLWTLEVDEFDPTYTYSQSHGDSWRELIEPYFSPGAFDGGASWAIGDRWEGTDLGAVFDPNDRYEETFGCGR